MTPPPPVDTELLGFAAAVAWMMVIPMIALTFLYTRFVFRR